MMFTSTDLLVAMQVFTALSEKAGVVVTMPERCPRGDGYGVCDDVTCDGAGMHHVDVGDRLPEVMVEVLVEGGTGSRFGQSLVEFLKEGT